MKDKSRLLLVTVSLILAAMAAAFLVAPELLLATTSGTSTTSTFSSDSGPTVFSGNTPYPATSDQYAPIGVSYSDPDGTHGLAKMSFDGTDVTKWCGMTSKRISYAHNGTKLAAGQHHVDVSVWDSKGNITTDSWDFTVDDTAPLIIAPALCGQTVGSATPAIDYSYVDPGYPGSGSGINTLKTSLKIDGAIVAATVDQYGASYTPSQPLNEGPHTAQLTVYDIAGNMSTHTCSFTVDSEPPAINSQTPAGDSTIGVDNPLVQAAWSDAGAGIDQYSGSMTLDGKDVTAGATRSQYGISYQAQGLAPGSHSVTVSVSDKAGRSSTSTWQFDVIDGEPPVITPPASCGTITGNSVPTLSYAYADSRSGIDQYSVSLMLDGGAVAANVSQYGASYTPAAPLADGSHTAVLSVRDKAGNTATHSCSFTVDTAPPVFGTLAPVEGGATDVDNPLVQAAWSDAGAGIDQYSGSMTLDGKDVTAAATRSQYGISYQAQGLGQGTHTVAVGVNDLSGKHAARSWSFSVHDTQPPAITPPAQCGSTISDVEPALTYSYSDPSGIDAGSASLTIDGAAVAVYAGPNNLTYIPSAPLAQGQHTAILTIKDTAGTAASDTCSFTINSDGPVISNLTPARNSVLGTSMPVPLISAGWADAGAGVDAYSAQLTLDGVNITNWASINQYGISYQPAGLGLGFHWVTLTVKDKAGLSSGVSAWAFMIVDTVPPVVNMPALCGGATSDTQPALDFTYYDPGAGGQPATGMGMDLRGVFMYVDNAAVAAYTDQYGVSYTPPGPLPEGHHRVTIKVGDRAANKAAYHCDFAVDTQPPVIDSTSPADGDIVGPAIPQIKISWHDTGAGIDVYGSSLKVDGTDVTARASVSQYGLTYTPGNLASGSHSAQLMVKDLAGHEATRSWSFAYAYPVSYYAPWYDSVSPGMNGNWVLIGNQADTTATVDVYIGGAWKPNPADKSGHFYVPARGKVTPVFPGTIGGPVQVISRGGEELLVSQRVLYRDSFNETMAVRDTDLDTGYSFTWYDSKSPQIHGDWILVSNPGTQAAAVDVYIGGSLMHHYDIPAGGKITPTFASERRGPVRVVSTNGEKIIASQRVLYGDSFSETMGLPDKELDQEYYFTWYDSKPQDGMNGNWILVGNSAATDAYVDIYIGHQKMSAPVDQYGGRSSGAAGNQYGSASGDQYAGKWRVPAGGVTTASFPNTIGGLVHVVCTSCASGHNIIVSQRVLYKSSFEEVQGTSPRDLGTSAVFPWYDFSSPGMNGNWILIGNTDASRDAYSQVFVGGGRDALSMYGNGGDRFFAGSGGGSVTPIFPGVIGGPLTVSCITCQPDQKLIISQRVIYKNSFNEVVGKPPQE